MSHKSKFEDDNVISIKEAIKLIKENRPKAKVIDGFSGKVTTYPVVSFIHLEVKNKKGIKFTLSGRASESDYLHLQASIPKYNEDGDMIFHDSGFSTVDYSISFHEYSGTSDVEFSHNFDRGKVLFKDVKKYISFIENRDWINKKIIMESKTRQVTYEEVYYEIGKL